MKNQRTTQLRIAAAIVVTSVVGLTAATVIAIPNQVGAIGFINPAGMRLEDFANRGAWWKGDAALKGDWEMWNDESIEDSTIEVIHLQNSAIVFGIKAASVTLQRRDGMPLQFEVSYSTEKEKRPGQTQTQLIANINAWSGGSISAELPSLDHEAVTVTIGEEADNVIAVTLSPLQSPGT